MGKKKIEAELIEGDGSQAEERAKKKSVQFNLDGNEQFEIEPRLRKQQKLEDTVNTKPTEAGKEGRSWQEDPNENRQTGKFTDEEISLLKESLCKYAFEKDLGDKGLMKLVSEKSSKETLGAWTQIAECLPSRSVQSCHNFCRRRFNPNNYGGKWTSEETQHLIALVKEHGRKWKTIGETLGRTDINVRDKYRHIGEENSGQRVNFWSLEELVKLLKEIRKHTGLKLLKNKKQMKKEMLENGTEINEQSKLIAQTRHRVRDLQNIDPNIKFILNYINFEPFKNIQEVSIPWTIISDKMKSKSKDDCKNKWNQYLLKVIFEFSGNFEEEEEEELAKQIFDQDVESESEIDFHKINNGKSFQENKMKWNILKKRVTSRSNVSVPEILNELLGQFKRSKKINKIQQIIQNSSSELVNFYKQNYASS